MIVANKIQPATANAITLFETGLFSNPSMFVDNAYIGTKGSLKFGFGFTWINPFFPK